MKTSETLSKIAPALQSAFAEMESATKNAKNPHFRSSYADLTSVLDTVRPVLAAHGLTAIQAPGWSDGRLTLTTRILHNSGEWIESTAETPISKADPQGVGSAITYLRRYSLSAICGVTQEDDDGNAASQPKRRPYSPAVVKAREVVEQAQKVLQSAEADADVATLAKYTRALEDAVRAGDEARCAKGVAVIEPILSAIVELDLVDVNASA